MPIEAIRQTPKMYEPPALKVVGSVFELTLTDKVDGPTDGLIFINQQITNASP